MPKPPKLAVVGSLNIDYFTRVERFPRPGETVAGEDLAIRFGGKGANQAVAASRLGADVAMVGCVGDDEMGRRYRERLDGFGIGVSGVACAEDVATGSAFINVDANAENTIVVASGANGLVSAAHVDENASPITEADVLLLQNEVPHDANAAAANLARGAGKEVIYNPAPWDSSRDVSAFAASLIVVNEHEAGQLAQVGTFSRLVVTRGSKSTIAQRDGDRFEVPTIEVEPADTVGAGDAFVGALAVALAEGVRLEEAVGFANRAGAMATLMLGAQEAMPERSALG